MAKQKYFSHDSNARNDEKIVNMRMQIGAIGYAIYFMILERLRESEDFMGVRDYNVIAFDLRVDAKDVKRVVEDFGLFQFTDDGKLFYSDSFRDRMRIMESKRIKQVEAGKRTASMRWSGPKSERDGVTNLSEKNNSTIGNLSERSNLPIANLSKAGNLPIEGNDVVTNLHESDNLPIIEGSGEDGKITNLHESDNLPIKSVKRKEAKEKEIKGKTLLDVEPSTKAEDSMSLTPNGVTDASSSSGSSLLFDVPEVEKESEIDYAELVTFWNTVTKGAFGRLKNIENKRRQMTRARIRENGKDSFLQAIRNAAASEFLHTVTWFDYDWMICPNNFVKVFEDKYGKKERVDSAGSGGLGPAGLASANSIPMGGKEARVETTYRKRIYD